MTLLPPSSYRSLSHLLAVCAVVVVLSGTASAQSRPSLAKLADPVFVNARTNSAKPFAALSASLHSLRDSIVVSVVKAQLGTRYVLGGTTPQHGFDCSGLVRYVMATLKVALPRTAAQQAMMGLPVGRDTTRLRPGDLLTFGRQRGVSHIGIYVGNGRYVHASPTAGRVIESDLNRTASPLIKRWQGVRRVVAGADPDSARRTGG